MELGLRGRRALVTGGNSGIGEAIVRELGQEGARVAVNYVTHPEAAERLVAGLKAKGTEAIALKADVSDPGQVAEMFAQLDRAFGGIDVLVNNAGIDGPWAPVAESDPVAWERVLRVDLVGPYLCAREAVRRMVAAKRGVVLNMSSVHEKIAWSGYSAYATAKAGLSMFTKTLAQEASPAGVRVLALAPGAVQTPINQDVWSNPEHLKDLLSKIPLGRVGRPEEVARVAAFLVSDAASYVTGSTVYVDGAMIDYPSFSHGG